MTKLKACHLKDPAPPLFLEQAVLELPKICKGYLPIRSTLELFFNLFKASGSDASTEHRLSFWLNYLERGLITDTWLVLGPRLAQIVKEQGLKDYQYACLDKLIRDEEEQGILLLGFRKVVVADWSHTGKCRFWLRSNEKCPRLFLPTYTRNQIYLAADYVQQHYFSAQGLWQKDAAGWLALHAQEL